ncbi:unnamed protein product [Rodentolepis nana]|uniref:Uncharacterized protein n=1 Tax=Rodentolepis nana TaxID=102285 RepID=A0A0R3TIV3_RODNA|nr:unnamed protein product [Rodentolepis nana]
MVFEVVLRQTISLTGFASSTPCTERTGPLSLKKSRQRIPYGRNDQPSRLLPRRHLSRVLERTPNWGLELLLFKSIAV